MKFPPPTSLMCTLLHQTWLHHMMLLIFILTFCKSLSASSVSYNDHCASVIPEAIPTVLDHIDLPILERETSYYNGGEPLFSKDSPDTNIYNISDASLQFKITNNVHRTNTSGTYMIEASLSFIYTITYHLINESADAHDLFGTLGKPLYVSFQLNGFWSESSGKLCMVGSASWSPGKGQDLNLDAILELDLPGKNSSIMNSIVVGTLKSLSPSDDPSYFQPISISGLPELKNYSFLLASKDADDQWAGDFDVLQSQSLALKPETLCSDHWSLDSLKLEYAGKCKPPCYPFNEGSHLPEFISLYTIQCSTDKMKLRYIIKSGSSTYEASYRSFDPTKMLIGEGSWNAKENRLHIVACRILNSSKAGGHIGDCSTRLTIWYPATWTITDRSRVVGQIWTRKTANDSGYFDMVKFRNYWDNSVQMSGLKYNYTEHDRASNSCPIHKTAKKKRKLFRDSRSSEMRLDMSVKSNRGNFASGKAVPIFVGDELFEQSYGSPWNRIQGVYGVQGQSINSPGFVNMSYKLEITQLDGSKVPHGFTLGPEGQLAISAEGVYDPEMGNLCMVGCRKINLRHQNIEGDIQDCEIDIKFKFAPEDATEGEYMTGHIQSMRSKTDPLYFEPLRVSSSYVVIGPQEKRTIWRMNLEITMIIISNILGWFFVTAQLFHLKRRPEMLPFVSLVMLAVMVLGHMIPLVLNYNALFLEDHAQDVFIGNDKLLKVNVVIVRVITMITFLLEFHLLQLTWKAKWKEEHAKKYGIAEKKASCVSLLLYFMCGWIALIVNWLNHKYDHSLFDSQIVWGALRCYGGLVLDGFLFPQILLNIFNNSKGNALSPVFYIGTTFVRILPHAYVLCRDDQDVNLNLDGLLIYSNQGNKLHSTCWDIIIPFSGILLAVVIWLQQQFGGRCILPKKLEDSEDYERLPAISH